METVLAAERLGVSRRQVERLVETGALVGVRTAGGAWLVDAASVEKRRVTSVRRGRPWNAWTAWAALFLVSGMPAPWTDSRQSKRIAVRLTSISAEGLVAACRRKATRHVFRAGDSFLSDVQAMLVPSGVSALTADAHLMVSSVNRVEGYCGTSDLPAVVSRGHLVPDPVGNLVVHVADCQEALAAANGVMPAGVVGVDLANSLDPRERSAGLRQLKGLLTQWR
jgi:excisionase family DNA binding protein